VEGLEDWEKGTCQHRGPQERKEGEAECETKEKEGTIKLGFKDKVDAFKGGLGSGEDNAKELTLRMHARFFFPFLLTHPPHPLNPRTAAVASRECRSVTRFVGSTVAMSGANSARREKNMNMSGKECREGRN
jgi:hypothetical protein